MATFALSLAPDQIAVAVAVHTHAEFQVVPCRVSLTSTPPICQ